MHCGGRIQGHKDYDMVKVRWRHGKRKKNLIHKHFLLNYRQTMLMKFQTLKYEILDTKGYVKEFEMLFIRCELIEPNKQIITCFVVSLKYDILRIMDFKSSKF